MNSYNSLIWLALLLFVLWIVLRVALAVSGGFLHLLWIGAIIFALIWVFQNIRGHWTPRS